MKKLHIALLLFAFVGMTSTALAQEPQEFKISIGDTLVWKPFDKCTMASYSVKEPNNISYRPIMTGDRLQIIALKAGKSSVIATCNDNPLN